MIRELVRSGRKTRSKETGSDGVTSEASYRGCSIRHFNVGASTGTGKTLSATVYPSSDAQFSKAVTSEWGWN
jgi:hypothetical protein